MTRPHTPVAARLLGYAQHKVHPQLREWSNEEAIRSALQEDLEGDLERLDSDALAAQFAHHCGVAGAKEQDYKTV